MSTIEHTSMAERERLAILIEECAELQKAAAKVLRHGWKAEDKGIEYNNRSDVQTEAGDVRAAMIRMCNAGDLNKLEIHRRADEKLATGGTLLRFPE